MVPNFLNSKQQMDMKNHMNQFSNPISSTTPQTPSSIPDIILTADDGSDRSEPPDAPTVHEPDQPAEPRSFVGSFTVTFFNIKIK